MASRATRYFGPVFRSSLRSSRPTFRASARRGMSSTTSQPAQSSDLPWIIGSGVIFVPTIAWILTSGKGEKHAHPNQKTPKEHVEAAEAAKEASNEPAPEPVSAEQTPEPVPEEKPAETTPEPDASGSQISDDEGVAISKEELEESINKAVDADVPKEANVVEKTEATSTEPASVLSETEPVKDSKVAELSKEEPAEVAQSTTTEKKETKSH